MHYYTPREFIEAATLEGGVYWLEADGTDVIVTVPGDGFRRRYGLRGPLDGTITVGGGDGDAIRDGDGIGSAIRFGRGDGDAIRRGIGGGDAIRDGRGIGAARRVGSGGGDAIRDGDGIGSAHRDGSGGGDAIRSGDGYGDAFRRGSGRGDAIRWGTGSGSAHRVGSGDGDAVRWGHGIGSAIRDGDGIGSALTEEEEEVGRLRYENAALREVLAAAVECWDGPKYKHYMGPVIDMARALLVKHEGDGR